MYESAFLFKTSVEFIFHFVKFIVGRSRNIIMYALFIVQWGLLWNKGIFKTLSFLSKCVFRSLYSVCIYDNMFAWGEVVPWFRGGIYLRSWGCMIEPPRQTCLNIFLFSCSNQWWWYLLNLRAPCPPPPPIFQCTNWYILSCLGKVH